LDGGLDGLVLLGVEAFAPKPSPVQPLGVDLIFGHIDSDDIV